MHDLPSQTMLQQAHARAISGGELEMLGKRAAAGYQCGQHSTLNDAVVETVKQAGLSPEQVRRVIEFTNQAAYIAEFKKEGADHKYVEFDGGPADPSEILKDLNDGGGGTVFDRGALDYDAPPTKQASVHDRNRAALGLEKVASVAPDVRRSVGEVRKEAAFDAMFHAEPVELPHADPYAPIVELRDKLASARDELATELWELESMYRDVGEDLYEQVKQAALEGVPLGHVLHAWSSVNPGPGFVKAAFADIGPRLVQEQVFPSLDAMGSSLEKTASVRAIVDEAHPLVQCFAAYCGTLEKLAHTRVARDEILTTYDEADRFVKSALAKESVDPVAMTRGAWRLAKRGAGHFGDAAETVVGGLGGERAGSVAKWVGDRTPEIAAVLAAKGVYDAHPIERAKSYIPGTRANYVRRMSGR